MPTNPISNQLCRTTYRCEQNKHKKNDCPYVCSYYTMRNDSVLHIVVFPWLAMGHLIPFFRLCKCLAQKGHRVYFISTPSNIKKIPKIPASLSSLIEFVTLPMPHVINLPNHAESSADVPYTMQQLLKRAFDSLEFPISAILKSLAPDWIIYDYASHWLPPLATKLGISRAFFALFTAATLALTGPPSVLINDEDSRSTIEDFTAVPPWIPFETNLAFRPHEVARWFESSSTEECTTRDTLRFGLTIEGSEVVVIRSSPELEPEWFNLLEKLYQKTVMPVGFLPPKIDEEDARVEEREKWVSIKEWLDKRVVNSVIYVALGTEATLTREQLSELALGLELSELQFFWVLRNLPESNYSELEMLPDGFVERVKSRGMVHVGWVPQVRILRHESVGGFLTHCGWNSVIEGLALGRVLVLFPVLNDQGINARLLSEKGLGVEIRRNESDGSFTRHTVAKSLWFAMVDDSGESLRAKTKQMRDLFGTGDRNDHYLESFIRYLKEYRTLKLTKNC